jgi:periplasmic protein CpxP/Spy
MVGLLTLLNVALLVTIWQKPPHGPMSHAPRPADRIIHELNFTHDQQNEFEKLKRQHHDAMLDLQSEGRALRDEFFELLKQENPDQAAVTEKVKAIAKNQEDIEMVTFNHFQQVRKLCNPEQQKRFDNMIKDLLHTMAGPPGRKRD